MSFYKTTVLSLVTNTFKNNNKYFEMLILLLFIYFLLFIFIIIQYFYYFLFVFCSMANVIKISNQIHLLLQ